jgi:hypothetical protein
VSEPPPCARCHEAPRLSGTQGLCGHCSWAILEEVRLGIEAIEAFLSSRRGG